MKINNLIPTQNELRTDLTSMIEYVTQGKIFDGSILKPPNKLIAICQFEDGKLFIRDGHHRCEAILLSSHRDYLEENEYKIEERQYSEFTQINISSGWITPFHPVVEVRRPNIQVYKDRFPSGSIEGQIAYVMSSWHKQVYCERRRFWNFGNLSQAFS